MHTCQLACSTRKTETVNTGELTFWTSGVWLIPIILLLTLVGLYLLVRYWQGKTREDARRLRSELRAAQARRHELELALRIYSPEDPEPYGARVANLYTRLREIDATLRQTERLHVSLQEGMRALARTRWQAVLGAPFLWYELRREVTTISQRLDRIRADLKALQEVTAELEDLPWQVAQQARALKAEHERAAKTLKSLHERRVHGEEMQRAVRREAQARETLVGIPAFFLEAEREQVLRESDKESVVAVAIALENAGPELKELLSKLSDWQEGYERAGEHVAKMRAALDAADNALAQAPETLDLAPLYDRLEQLEVIADTLQATLSRMEVESMASVREEAERVQHAAREMESQVKEAGKEVTELAELLPRLNEELRSLSTEFAALGTGSTHRVQWTRSRDLLTQLSRDLHALAPPDQARTPEQVHTDLIKARELNTLREQLARRCREVGLQHAELLQCLDSPEMTQGLENYDRAMRLLEKIREYGPENAPRNAPLNEVEQELETFRTALKQVIRPDRSEAIPEGEVRKRLEQARSALALYENLRERLEILRLRLQELRDQEQRSQELLDGGRTMLTQMSLLANSNPFLGEIARRDVDRLLQTQEQLARDLEHPEQGSVEKKLQAVENWLAKIVHDTNQWIDSLEKEIKQQQDALGEQLASLSSIAALEDRALLDAERLLNEGERFQTTGRFSRPSYPAEEILPELKRRSDHWQKVQATAGAVDDLAKPVMEAQRQVADSRGEVVNGIEGLSAELKGTRGWPPTTVDLDDERNELADIDEEWEQLRRLPARPITMVQQWERLAGRYRALSAQVRQEAARAGQEMQQVMGIEAELNEFRTRWEEQFAAHRDNPVAVQSIRSLVAEYEGELKSLQRDFKRGNKNYAGVVQGLQTLRRALRTAQVPFDENSVLDISGRVIPYR